MFSLNIWTQARLVNGALGTITEIIYNLGYKPPHIPMYVVASIDNYSSPPWDPQNPECVPITPITLGNRSQLPITMAWEIKILISQGLTLYKETIDIGKIERQGLMFTAMSRVRSLSVLRIDPTFSFNRYKKMQYNPYTILRKKEERRLQQLSSNSTY